MGIFGKASSVDPTSINQARNRRNSSSAVPNVTTPVSIVPAPSQGVSGAFLKPLPSANSSSSSVFGRQQSWSDQLADSNILKGAATGKIGSYPPPPVIPTSHNANILYGNVSNSNNSNDVKFVHSTMEILENQIKREEAPKKKRTRTSTEQLRILQKAFQTDPMPNSSARVALSKKLGMSTRAVQVWFQNRRAKEKLDAKRNVMGLSGGSSFTYVKGNNSDDEEDLEGNGAPDDDCEYNFDEEGSLNGTDSSSNASTNNKSSEFIHSMKANGLIGRMAFGDSNHYNNNGLMKSQRSCSTPNGFFLGIGNNNNNNSLNDPHSFMSSGGQVGINGRYQSKQSTPSLSGHFGLNNNNPLCHLFPGETFISDVNEVSVDQLYQDLGGAGSIPSPIDDLGGSSNHPNLNISSFLSSTSASNSSSVASGIGGSSVANSSFFTFGDPFYGGGIIDRTPSVSPVGFGPRSHFYTIGSSFDFINPTTSTTTTTNLPVTNSTSTASDFQENHLTIAPVSSNACKGLSGGNVYLTSSIGSVFNINNNNNNLNANRRSFSLPEAHGNLTAHQMQQLENFGLQVLPSPLLSINEEDSKVENVLNNNNDSNNDSITLSSTAIATNNNPNNNNSSSNDFLIPFSDFLEGEVIR